MSTMIPRLALLFFALVLSGNTQQAPASKAPTFSRNSYPASKFRVTENKYTHGDVSIRIIEVKNRGYALEPRQCRAWLEVTNGERLLKRIYYPDIDPSGFSFGIFVPKLKQPDNYFVAVKEGDYDGRLLLVGKDGTVTDLPGGFYFVTVDKRFLVGEYATDGSPLVVVDVERHIAVIDGTKDDTIPDPFNFYRDSSGYFYTEASDSNGSWNEIRDHVYRVDLEHHRVVRRSITAKELSAAHKVDYDFDPQKLNDCYSTEQ